MEAETKIPEEASAMGLPLDEPITKNQSEEIKFSQENGNNSKDPLVEDTRQIDGDKIGEISKTKPQEIYHKSSKARAESEKQDVHQLEGHRIEKILKHANSEGLEMAEVIRKSGVPNDKVLSTLPTKASVGVETVEESFQEEIHKETEAAVTDTEEVQRPENDFEQKKNEASDLQEATAENEKKDEPQSEAESQETIVIKHRNLEGHVTTTDPSNDTEEFEKAPASQTKEKLEIKDRGKFKQEEAEDMEDTKNMKLLKSSKESVLVGEAPSTLPTSAIAKSDTVEEILQKQTLKKAESAAIDNDGSCKSENELEKTAKVVEAFDLPETMGKVDAENEEHAEHQPEAPTVETVVTRHIISEVLLKTEISNESSHNVEELEKIPEKHSVENSEIKDGVKTPPKEAIYIKEGMDVELPIPETQSVPEDKALSTLPTSASFGIPTVEENIQEEKQKEAESPVTDTEAGKRPENYFEEKKKDYEDLDVHEVTSENEKRDEPQSEAQSSDTIVLKLLNLGNTKETDSSNDTEEPQEVPASHCKEKLEIKDGGKEEVKEAEDATDKQSPKSAQEGVPDDEALSALPTLGIAKDETIEEIFQEITQNEEPAVIDNDGSGQSEQEHELIAKVVEASHPPQTLGKVSEEKEEHADHQPKAQTVETTPIKHTISEALVTMEISMESSYDEEEQEKFPKSYPVKNLEIKDGGKAPPEEAICIKEATAVDLLVPETQSVTDKEAPTTLLTCATAKDEMVEGIYQEQTLKGEDSAPIESDGSSKSENEPEQMAQVVETFDLPETMGEASKEKEKHADHQSKAPTVETVVTRHTISEGLETTEINVESSYDEEEQEKIAVSHSVENSETKDGGKTPPQEAIYIKEAIDVELSISETQSVPEDKVPSILPTTASAGVQTDEESIQEEIHNEAESAVTDHEAGKTPENNFEETKKDYEASNHHEAIAENEKKEAQSEAQSLETTAIKHSNFEGYTTETDPVNDTEELEKVPVSHSKEKLDIKDRWKEEAKEAEEATDKQSPKSAKESVPDDEDTSTFPMVATAKGQTVEEIFQDQTFKEEESTVIENDGSSKSENGLEQKAKIVETLDPPVIMGKVGEEKEEHADHKSEAPKVEAAVTRHTISEAFVPTVICTELSYDMEERQKIPDSHSVENLEIKDGGNSPSEAATDAELPIYETQSEPEDEALSTLHATASVSVETVEESIQEEIHKEIESPVTDTEAWQRLKNDFEEKKNDSESLETTILKHPNLGHTTEIVPNNDTEELEKIPASHSKDKLEFKDGGKFRQEEAKEAEEETNMKSPKSEKESVPDDGALSSLPKSATFKGETVDEIFKEQTIKEEVSEPIHNDESSKQENELEQTAKVVEAFDPPENMGKVSKEKEEHADNQSEAPTVEPQVTRRTILNELVAMEISTESSYDVDEREKILKPYSVKNLEIKDSGKTLLKEAMYIKEATDVELSISETQSASEDKALPTLPTTATVGVETVEESIQEVTHKEVESAVPYTKAEQREENNFDEKKNDLEASDFHKATAENEKNDEPQSEVQSQETIVIKDPKLEGYTTDTGPHNDAEEPEKVAASHIEEKVEIRDAGKFIEEKANETEPTDMQLPKSVKEIVPEDEALSTLPTSAIAKGETVDKIFQEPTLEKEESAEIDNDGSCTPENEFEQTATVVEAFDAPETMVKVGEEKEEHADHQSEASKVKTTLTRHTITESSNDTEEFEKIPESVSDRNSHIKDGGETLLEEVKYTKEATDVELSISETQNMPEDIAISTLSATASVRVETVEESIQEEINKEVQTAVTATNEEQRPENDFEKKVPEASGFHEATAENEKKDEPQSEVQSQKTTVINHPNLGYTTKTKPSNDTEELQKFPASHTKQKLEIKDGGKFIQENEKETEEATDMQLLKSAKESVPDDEAPSTLATSAIAKGETVDEIFQEPTLKEEESAEIDNDGSCKPENEHDQMAKGVEAFDPPETMGNDGTENKEHPDHQSQAPTMETVVTWHTISEGLVIKETHTESNYNEEEAEKIPESHSVENSKIKDGKKSLLEEAIYIKEAIDVDLPISEIESVPEDKALSALHTTASVRVETVEESIQEEIHKEAESEVTYTEEAQRPENHFEDKKKAPEAFDLNETTSDAYAENEKKDDPQSEGQSLETKVIKHPNLEGETTKTNPSTDTEELEKVLASHTRKKLDINDGIIFIQEEEKGREEATDTQLLKSAKESAPDDEVTSTSSTLAIVKGETIEDIFQEQTLKEVESAAIDNDGSCKPENKLEQTTKVDEATDPPETMGKFGTENEKHDDPQYEAATLENVITEHTNSEGTVTMESSTESTYDVEEQEKILESHSVESSEINDVEKSTRKEEIYIKEATHFELPKSETESVLEVKAQSTLPTAASVRLETVDKSIQEEIHKEAESTRTDTEEGQKQENDFEEKKNVQEAFDLQEATENTCAEYEKKDRPQSEMQNLETIVIKHPNFEGDTAETNPSDDNEELEKVQASHTQEKVDIKDGRKFIHEEATDMQLLKKVTASVPDNEAPSTLPTKAIVKGEIVDEIFEEQTLKEEESAAIDNDGSCKPENELEQTTKIVEAIELPENTGKVSAENEELADSQSEAPTSENVNTKHTVSEGTVTKESSSKSSYDVEKLEKIPESHSVKNSEINDGEKVPLEEITKEATNVELQKSETESVPEDKSLSTTTTASAEVESVKECIQEEIHKEAESAVTDTEEGQRSENDFEEKKKVPEAFYLYKETGNICGEKENKSEPQSEALSVETMLIKHSNLEGIETTDMSTSNKTEEHEKVPASHTRQELEIKDDGITIQAEEKEMEGATDTQLLKPARESVTEDEASSILPGSAIVKGETDELSFQQQTLKEEKSTAMENDKSCRTENELEQMTNVRQAIDLSEIMGKVNTENEEQADHQSEAPSIKNVITKHTNSEGMLTREFSRRSSDDLEEVEKIRELHFVENSEIEDRRKTMQEEAIYTKKAINVELPKSETESVPEDKALTTLLTAPSGGVKECIQEEIHKEAKSAGIINTEEEQRAENDFEENKILEAFDFRKATGSTCMENEKRAEPQSQAQTMETRPKKHPNLEELETTDISPSNNSKELEKVPASHTEQKLDIKDGGKTIQEEEKEIEETTYMQLLKSATESVPEDESSSTSSTPAIVKGEAFEKSFQKQIFQEEKATAIENNKSCGPENELVQMTKVMEHVSKEAPSMENEITKHINSERMVTMESSTKLSYDVVELEKIPESSSVENSENEDGGKIMPEEATHIKEGTDVESQKSETENVPEDQAISTLPTIASVRVETIEKSIQEEIHEEAESAVTDTKEGQRPEYELKEFDPHKVTGNTSARHEKEAEPQSDARNLKTMTKKHPNLEGLESAEISSSNDTEEPEKEHEVSKPGGVSGLVSADITKECANEDIPKLEDLRMLSDQNTNNSISDISEMSSHEYCKLDYEKEEKQFMAASGCTATSTNKNNEAIEGQKNSETTFEDSLTGVATERATTDFEVEDSIHEHEIPSDTPAEKIVKAADTNERLELAPESMAKEQSDEMPNQMQDKSDTAHQILEPREYIPGENFEGKSQRETDMQFKDEYHTSIPRNAHETSVANGSTVNVPGTNSVFMEQIEDMDLKEERKSESLENFAKPSEDLSSFTTIVASEEGLQRDEGKLKTSSLMPQGVEKDVKSEIFNKDEINNVFERNDLGATDRVKNSLDIIDTDNKHEKSPESEKGRENWIPEIADESGHEMDQDTRGVEHEKEEHASLTLIPNQSLQNPSVQQTEEGKFDGNINNFEATDSNEQRLITNLSRKEASPRDSGEAIEPAGTEKLETQEAETPQMDSAKEDKEEDELDKISPSSIKGSSQDTKVKLSHKKSHGILSGVGLKVKHSISKVKKAIMGKSSQPKTPSSK